TVDEIASAWGFKSDLDKLKRNVDLIKAFLHDAEKRQTDDDGVRHWLLILTEVVYAADDLFDEFITVATRKQLNGGNKFSNEVHTFFSRYNQIAYAHRIARKIKVIREEIEGIVKQGNDLKLVSQSYVEGRVITKRRDQSYSFVEANQVIGRDADKNAILDLLLASSSSGNDEHEHEQSVLPVIVIVGMGGLGKTALAQYIYNDPSIDEFFELKLWVCVSDVFDVKEITEKILKSVTNSETPKLEMDQLQSRLRNEIGDKKYFLVLDDVWNDSREEWLKMRALLKTGRKGSKILVTTRWSKVATVMCTFPIPPYDLQGLSKEKSWELFEKLAFTPGQAQRMPHLVDIGKEMVRKCANVPLAIRIVGSILYGEDESKWLSIRDKNLSKLSDKQKNIMDILKISYHHLASPLKNCFAYCALFPKDYNFNKDVLINLWMAEGFIVLAADESMSLEEFGEEYFLTLLQRGLFQDVQKDEWGCIESCKMHDFIHDLAQDVAKPKCLVIKADQSFDQNSIYHLSFAFRLNFQRTIPFTVLSLRRLRTLLLPQQRSDESTFGKCQHMISKLTYLRVLDLHALGLKNLPGSIGKLIHLRYLNLSSNPFRVLPDSITELHNLQTLNLNNCRMLFKLPSNIKKTGQFKNS
ncbi:putative disease resistance protein RGA3, partial [Amaranthus tricolor]|uniref:putative disease resistance protein RGA3 n=1 Tax=Amaranthus tricolor TaxID=29722 RepID=UPI002585C1AD